MGHVVSGGGFFRTDIQGMRALAVGLVILDHAGFGTLAGGFIGVDVFFVISGFLIVGLLVREGADSGRISITAFYARRARRIIPAAAVVLVATTIAATMMLPLLRSLEIFKDALWAALFGANIRFSMVETDYFAQGEPPSPLQHYWSLSVEEQFYVVIPALLALVLLVARRRGKPSQGFPVAVAVVLALVVAVSLAWSVHQTGADPTAAYFSTLVRAWELAIGGLLATLMSRGQLRLGRWPAELLGWGGLAAIAVATLTFDARTAFPGVAALLPVLGTVALLAAGGSTGGESTAVFRLLSITPARLVGDWSYSLYLWHFPVLRLVAEREPPAGLTRPELAVSLLLILGLSVATYYLVEQPFRRGASWRKTWRAVALYPASVGLVGIAVFAAHAQVDAELAAREDNPAITTSQYADQGLSKDPVVGLVEASVLASQEDRPIPGHLEPGLQDLRQDTAPLGDCDYRTGTDRLCPFGDPDADRSIVVTGDSHARAWGPAFAAIGEKYGYAVYQFVYSGCPANKATRKDPANGQEWTACKKFKQWTRSQVAELQPDLVVVSNSSYITGRLRTRQVGGLERELKELAATGSRVAMVGNTPKLPRQPGVCLSTRDVDLGDCLFEPDAEVATFQQKFAEVTRGLGMTFVDADKWFCADGLCPSVVGRHITMRDKEHMTTGYAEVLAEPLARELDLLGGPSQAG